MESTPSSSVSFINFQELIQLSDGSRWSMFKSAAEWQTSYDPDGKWKGALPTAQSVCIWPIVVEQLS